MGLFFQDIADRLQISVSTAHRLYIRFEQTGEVALLKPKIRQDSHKLDDYHKLYIIGILIENPSLYLKEICQKISATMGVIVSESTVCRLLRRNGLTRKKINKSR